MKTQSMKKIIKLLLLGGVFMVGLGFPSTLLYASDVNIVDVSVQKNGAGSYSFQVSLKHADTGWKHYADVWKVVSKDGKIYGTRVLQHPHVNEQPFRRGLSNVSIPAGVQEVWIEAGCNQSGITAKRYRVKLS